MKKDSEGLLTIFKTALLSILLGAVIGGTTNIINGKLCPYYFSRVMGWDFPNIWPASIAQGIFEGLQYGLIFSIVFTTSFGLITKGKGTLEFAMRHLFKISIFVYLCWTIGGILLCFMALLSPDFFYAHFLYDTKLTTIELIKYAWVKGSINGGLFGGLLSAFVSIVNLKNGWKQILTEE